MTMSSEVAPLEGLDEQANPNQGAPVNLSELPGIIPTSETQFPGPQPRGEQPPSPREPQQLETLEKKLQKLQSQKGLKGKKRVVQLKEIGALKRQIKDAQKKHTVESRKEAESMTMTNPRSPALPPQDTAPPSPVGSVKVNVEYAVAGNPGVVTEAVSRLRRHNTLKTFKHSIREAGFYRWDYFSPELQTYATQRFDQITNDDFACRYFVEKTIATMGPKTIHSGERVARSVAIMMGFAIIMEWWNR